MNEAKRRKAKFMYIEAGSAPMFKKVNEMYKKYGFEEKFRIKDFWSKNDDLVLFMKRVNMSEKS